MKTVCGSLIVSGLVTVSVLQGAEERINHEGRILGPLPIVTAPTFSESVGSDPIELTVIRHW